MQAKRKFLRPESNFKLENLDPRDTRIPAGRWLSVWIGVGISSHFVLFGLYRSFAMSSQYNIEPLPTGRVLVKTSMGPLDIELFAKETPQTCRSFIQLCLEGYYNNVIFHRIVKDFIIQTGD